MTQNQEQECVLQSHLELIVGACAALEPRPEAIILYGGYGRGEGGWYTDESGKWRPYNDYDIRVVVQCRIGEARLKALEKQLAEQIGIRWIDVGQFLPDDLPGLSPTILNYDFKHGSRVIFGEPDVLDAIPAFKPTDLTSKDGLILYFTRLYTLTGSLGPGGLIALAGEDSRYFRNQMAKALLAVADVLLLPEGAYDASYRVRVERVAALFPEKTDLNRLLQWAITEKLNPRAVAMSTPDVLELYASVHTHFLSEMYAILSRHFGRRVSGPADVERCMKWLPLNMAKRALRAMTGHGRRTEHSLAVMLAQAYVAASWSTHGVDDALLQRGIALLHRAGSHLDAQSGWDAARLEAARLRMEI